jgi:outer membrane biosynthesis protein TonB
VTGLPDDPSDRPTQLAEYGFDGPQQGLEQGPAGSAEHADSAAPDGAPEPWYRSRMLLGLWGLLAALLLALVIYGIVELSRGGSETGGPATTTSTTTTPSSTATPTTTPSTSIEEAPPPPESPDTPEQTPEEAPEEQPPPANGAPAPAEPPEHHHHLPHIPSTITLPHTVITLPHGR